MIYYILCFMTWVISIYFFNYILLSSFDFKKSGANRALNAALLWVCQSPFFIVKYLFNHISPLRNLMILCVLIVSCIYMHRVLKGKIWQKILFLSLQEVASFSAEIFVIIFLTDSLGISVDMRQDTLNYLILCVLIAATTIFLYLFMLLIWKRFFIKNSFGSTAFFLFALFPVSQVLLINATSVGVYDSYNADITLAVIGTFMGFLADGLLVAMILRLQRMSEMEQHVKDLKQALEVEKNHYQEIEARREELAKIRHDLKEQFLVMTELTNRQEYDKIATMLGTLTDYVAGTKETVYCGDSVVNAIMAENEKKCEANQIRLEYSLDIPVPLKLNPVVTCNLFSNLFRNAIRAVCMLSESAPPREFFAG